MEPAELGLEIKLLRERRRLTGKEFAEKIGLSQSQLSRLEKGERRVEATLLGTIARVLNVPPSFFFRDRSVPVATEEPPPADAAPDDAAGALISNEPTEPIGRVIRDARRRLHLTAEELAYKIGRGRQFVLGVERGDIELLNAEVTQKLCRALKIDPGAFVDAQRAEIRSLRRRVQRLEQAHAGVTLGTIEVDENDASNAQLVPADAAPPAGARRAIPVIVGPDGGMPLDIGPDGVPAGEVESFVFVPGVRDDAAFALFHSGDEMMPAIRDGDVCVFSPRSDVRSGDFALALAQPGTRPMVRQVFHDPRSTVRLQAISVAVPPVLVRRDEVSHLIRLVARVERY